ncbi:hypothetical protein [Phytobacter sp. V91]|uniref:hypothetical protein n=1 Tax=Phytobacter sp. V91 TaxID=3369425 RepID=UPI003F625418
MVAKVRNSEIKKQTKYLSLEDIDFTKVVKGPRDFHAEDPQADESDQYVVIKLPSSVDQDDFRVALISAVNALASVKAKKDSSLSSVRMDERNILMGLITPESKVDISNKDLFSSRNAIRLEKLKANILADANWLSSREVSAMASVNSNNTSAAPNRWKHANKIFALTIQGKDYFPQYALDAGGQPLPVMKKIIECFGESRTAWSLAIWLGTPNGWLNKAKPKDLLLTMPGKVMQAAEEEKAGARHG